MSRTDRMRQLQQALLTRHRLELAEAMHLLGKSESTVRRMFDELERDGRAIRTHGGIQLSSSDGTSDYSFELLSQSQHAEKLAIAELAAGLIRPGDVIWLDSGTTVRNLCLQLAADPRIADLGLKVFTNSYPNLESLSGRLPVVLIGGEYRPNRRDFVGYIAESALADLHFTRSFLGADGCLLPDGFQATDFNTARLCQIILRNSDESTVLCDSSKFMRRSLVTFARFDQINHLITDSDVNADDLAVLRRGTMDIRVAET